MTCNLLKEKTKGYLYTRVSTAMQIDGYSLEAQNSMVPGIIIGIVGMLMAVINYPIHKSILTSRKKKYAAQIMK